MQTMVSSSSVAPRHHTHHRSKVGGLAIVASCWPYMNPFMRRSPLQRQGCPYRSRPRFVPFSIPLPLCPAFQLAVPSTAQPTAARTKLRSCDSPPGKPDDYRAPQRWLRPVVPFSIFMWRPNVEPPASMMMPSNSISWYTAGRREL
jgi:hypothetical protein